MRKLLNRRGVSIVSKFAALVVFTILLVFVAKIVLWSARFMRETGITPLVVAKLIFNDGVSLESSGGRTNILILGIGGKTHEGSDLTDTMIVLSLDTVKKTTALISVPRDVWSDSLKDKVNSAYHYGEEKKKGGGLTLARATVEDVIGLPIHYSVVIDFSGFQKIIDAVGGVDVNVERAFTDKQYPIDSMENVVCPDGSTSCHYETIHFDAGRQHMDGARALIYARSRHAEGEEGSDFARNRRQQLLLIALKDKFMHPLFWITPGNVIAMPKMIDDASDMDMNIATAATIAKRFFGVREDQIKKISFDDRLENPPTYLYNNLYVLVPRTSWNGIHAYIKDQLQ